VEKKKRIYLPFPWVTSTVHVQFSEFGYRSGYPGDRIVPLGPLTSPPHKATNNKENNIKIINIKHRDERKYKFIKFLKF